MKVVGYARVSTREQNPDAQEAELRAAGAFRVFVDRGESSTTANRPQWIACLDYLRDGDTLVIRALDRIAGTELMAIELLATIEALPALPQIQAVDMLRAQSYIPAGREREAIDARRLL